MQEAMEVKISDFIIAKKDYIQRKKNLIRREGFQESWRIKARVFEPGRSKEVQVSKWRAFCSWETFLAWLFSIKSHFINWLIAFSQTQIPVLSTEEQFEWSISI